MKFFFQTDDSLRGLILRVALGAVMFPHGAQKLFGWFGGNGFAGTMSYFTEQMQIPALISFLVILAESFGSIGLILGLFTRLGAFGIMCNMIGAIVLVHWPYGFFMNWFGKQQGEGFEFHLLAIAIAVVVLIYGGGKWSLDGLIAQKLQKYK